MTLDSIMNWLMPLLIVSFFVGLLYIKLKEPADIFFGWIGNGIKNLLFSGKEKASESIVMGSEIVFE